MPRLTRPKHVRKREAYEQLLRETKVYVLEPMLHEEWRNTHEPATTNGQATARLAKRLPT